MLQYSYTDNMSDASYYAKNYARIISLHGPTGEVLPRIFVTVNS